MVAPTRRFPLTLVAALGTLAAAPRPASAQRIAEVQVAPRYMRMRQDAVAQLSATAYDVNGMPLDVRFRWRSSNINVVAVDSVGYVHALAPGNALVMAWTEEGGRRRVGQVTVQVLREPGAVGFPGAVPPGATPPGMPGGVPGAMPMPSMPAMPPGMPRREMIDSAIRASINCADPTINAVNPLMVCWDRRAALRDTIEMEPERPGPDRCPNGITPVGLLIQIGEKGEVVDVRPYSPSSCPELTERAIELARRLHFVPAMRAGQPIVSWRVMRMHGR
ncbi:MAG: hypothetical protein ACHQU1_05855 [Gemmatimonadales bacterium]